ncbi:uncharacterized protein JN550_007736 [Neoarthrinium moseri]|uniref:uncharacterized protein n=1 Tax=Neoarthrinium moseri TaxID=1658444 RepID=UPI001FDC63CD|nr:uncharacterized protein JN550_007736 [Neoarthrinium moseri]KAI1866348.1 hypothetical protein JN550_007736 [Neoarthrinium moseri]
MPLELRDVDFSDGATISHVYISAFYDDLFNKTQFPGVSFEKLLAGATYRWPRNYCDPSAHYKKVVDTDTGETVSYSKWEFVNSTAGDQLRRTGVPDGLVAERPCTPEGLDDAYATEFSAKVRTIYHRHMDGRPHMRLKMMGTLASHRRRGAAGLQLRWATDLADREGLACWTEASPAGLPVYEAFGFETKDAVVSKLAESIGGGLYTSTCVLREPRRNLGS